MTGCSDTHIQNEIDKDFKDIDGYVDANKANVKREIEELIQRQLSAINENNMDKYLETLNASESEYIAERKSWFRDIQLNNIKDLKIVILSIESLEYEEAIVNVEQSYTFNEESYVTIFPMRYIKLDDKWVDSDIAFSVFNSEHFVVKYPHGLAENATLAVNGAEEAYESIVKKIGIEPKDRTVIKLYNEKETLRQSVKLSFAWQFAGWYEYPESIKSMVYDTQQDYKEVIEHELTHKITIGLSNNNLPYWFAEGLAMYFTKFYDYDINIMNKNMLNNMWSISELEKQNLETMTDNIEISRYYNSSGLIVNFIVQEFGKEKLKELINELGEYQYLEGTGAEIDKTSIQRFHEVTLDILGMSIEELDRMYKQNILQ